MIEKNKDSNCNNDSNGSNGSNGSNIDATTTNTNTTTNPTNPTNTVADTVVDTVVDTGLMLFNNEEFGSVRVKMIDNEPWFVGKDVAVALGYAKPENAIGTHVELEDKTTTLIQGTGSNYKSKTVIINESGLYSLILSSKLESAKKFKKWVTGEVLPSIRKTGGYINDVEMFINTYLPNVDEQTRLLFKSNLMVIRDLNGKIDGLNEEVKGLNEKLGDKDKEIEGKNKELTNKSKTIVNLSGEIIDLHEVIGAKDDIIGEKDKEIEGKNKELENKNQELENKNQELENKDKEIETKDKELLRRNKVISKKSYAITKKNDMIAERDINLKEKEREIESKDREIESKNKIIEGKEKEIKSKDKIIETMTPKSEYYDNFMESEGLFSITTIAKQYGKSGKWMNEFLRDKGIQYKQNGTWCLYSKYCGKGYTENKGFVVRRKENEKRKGIGDRNGVGYGNENGNGKDVSVFRGKINMYWTPKGKEFIDGLMRDCG